MWHFLQKLSQALCEVSVLANSIASCTSLSWLLMLPVEMRFFHGVARKAFWEPIYGRIRYSGKINCRSKIKGLSQIQLCPTVEEVQACLLQAKNKGQDPEISCHWFSPYERLVQSSLCPHQATLISVPSCTPAGAVPRPALGAIGTRQLLGPHGFYGERTCPMNGTRAWGEGGERERPFVGLTILSWAWEEPGVLSN